MFGSPVLIAASYLPRYSRRANLRQDLTPSDISLEGIDVDKVLAAMDSPRLTVRNGVAIIPVTGAIEYKASLWGWFFGGTSITGLRSQFRAALADDQVDRILFDVDSPGGEYYGLPEFANEVFKARDVKPSTAIVNPLMASAATWIGTSAEKVYSIPSGFAGSVGTLVVLASWAEAYKAAGIDIRIIRNPEWKAESNPYEPISDSFVEYEQGVVDTITAEFHKALADRRGVTAKEAAEQFGQGRMMDAKAAVKAGLLDGVKTVDEVLGMTVKRSTVSASGRRRNMAPPRRY
jgi:ClpP class serine protease